VIKFVRLSFKCFFCSKNLECERDELRNQVEELCRMRTAAEEWVKIIVLALLYNFDGEKRSNFRSLKLLSILGLHQWARTSSHSHLVSPISFSLVSHLRMRRERFSWEYRRIIGFVSLRFTISLRYSRQFFIQSKIKPKFPALGLSNNIFYWLTVCFLCDWPEFPALGVSYSIFD